MTVETSSKKTRSYVLSTISVHVASGFAALLEAASSSLNLTIALMTAVLLATSLGGGLYFAAQEFRQAVHSSRDAVRTSKSPRSLSKPLRAVERTSQSAQQKLEQDFNAIRRFLKRETPPLDQRTTAKN